MKRTDGSKNVILKGIVKWYTVSLTQSLFSARLSVFESNCSSPVFLRRRAARCARMYSALVSGRQKNSRMKVAPEMISVSYIDQRHVLSGTEKPERTGPKAGPNAWLDFYLALQTFKHTSVSKECPERQCVRDLVEGKDVLSRSCTSC
jgi:hypothetical protein